MYDLEDIYVDVVKRYYYSEEVTVPRRVGGAIYGRGKRTGQTSSPCRRPEY